MKNLGLLACLLFSFKFFYASIPRSVDSGKNMNIYKTTAVIGAAMATTGLIVSGCMANAIIEGHREATVYLFDGLALTAVGGVIAINSVLALDQSKKTEHRIKQSFMGSVRV